ncbi:hypothetical protein Tco_0164682 [Tanacetum coccineum]
MLANGEKKKPAAADGVHINLKVKSQAYGSQVLYCQKKVEINPPKFNVNGDLVILLYLSRFLHFNDSHKLAPSSSFNTIEVDEATTEINKGYNYTTSLGEVDEATTEINKVVGSQIHYSSGELDGAGSAVELAVRRAMRRNWPLWCECTCIEFAVFPHDVYSPCYCDISSGFWGEEWYTTETRGSGGGVVRLIAGTLQLGAASGNRVVTTTREQVRRRS